MHYLSFPSRSCLGIVLGAELIFRPKRVSCYVGDVIRFYRRLRTEIREGRNGVDERPLPQLRTYPRCKRPALDNSPSARGQQSSTIATAEDLTRHPAAISGASLAANVFVYGKLSGTTSTENTQTPCRCCSLIYDKDTRAWGCV